jgi:hypothetical protein
LSDPGKKNGLYWEAKKGDEQSPLGPLVAAARKEGYTGNKPAGAYDYVAKGQMIGGFCPGGLSRALRVFGDNDVHREPRWRGLPEGPEWEHGEDRRGDEAFQPGQELEKSRRKGGPGEIDRANRFLNVLSYR